MIKRVENMYQELKSREDLIEQLFYVPNIILDRKMVRKR